MEKPNLNCPEELVELIEKRREKLQNKARQEIVFRQAQLIKEAEIDKLRLDSFEQLWLAAEYVFSWRDELAKNEVCQHLFRNFGDKRRLVVHVGKFWLGEPIEPTDIVCRARLVLNGNPLCDLSPIFLYQEVHKGQVSSVKEINTIPDLISAVHPDFLLEISERLHGSRAWECIVRDLT
jgi:hypothetical protein